MQHREWQPPSTANHQQVRLSRLRRIQQHLQTDFGDLNCLSLEFHQLAILKCQVILKITTREIHDSPVQSVQISQVFCFDNAQAKQWGRMCHKQLDLCSAYYHLRKPTFMDWQMMLKNQLHIEPNELQSKGCLKNSLKEHAYRNPLIRRYMCVSYIYIDIFLSIYYIYGHNYIRVNLVSSFVHLNYQPLLGCESIKSTPKKKGKPAKDFWIFGYRQVVKTLQLSHSKNPGSYICINVCIKKHIYLYPNIYNKHKYFWGGTKARAHVRFFCMTGASVVFFAGCEGSICETSLERNWHE